VETIALATRHHSPAWLTPYQPALSPKYRLYYHQIPMPESKVSQGSTQAGQPAFHVAKKY